jgi:hypothetical protein
MTRAWRRTGGAGLGCCLAVWAIAQGPIVARRISIILVHVHRVSLVMIIPSYSAVAVTHCRPNYNALSMP